MTEAMVTYLAVGYFIVIKIVLKSVLKKFSFFSVSYNSFYSFVISTANLFLYGSFMNIIAMIPNVIPTTPEN